MKKIIIWFLIAQKFMFAFAVVFGAIPITYAISSAIFDYSFFIFVLGITLYVLTVIPLAYAIGTGYDRLIDRVAKKKEVREEPEMITGKETDLSFNMKDDNEETTIVEKEN